MWSKLPMLSTLNYIWYGVFILVKFPQKASGLNLSTQSAASIWNLAIKWEGVTPLSRSCGKFCLWASKPHESKALTFGGLVKLPQPTLLRSIAYVFVWRYAFCYKIAFCIVKPLSWAPEHMHLNALKTWVTSRRWEQYFIIWTTWLSKSQKQNNSEN